MAYVPHRHLPDALFRIVSCLILGECKLLRDLWHLRVAGGSFTFFFDTCVGLSGC